MIAEKFPQLSTLDPQEQLILAGELWQRATGATDNSVELAPELVTLIEKRLDHFLANPETGISWDDLKRKSQNHE